MKIAILCDLYYSNAGVLLMVRAESAVQRTTVTDLRGELKWYAARTVESGRAHVHLSVRANDSLKPSMLGTSLLHVYSPVPDVDLSVENLTTFRADTLSQFYENGVAFSNVWSLQQRNLTQVAQREVLRLPPMVQLKCNIWHLGLEGPS